MLLLLSELSFLVCEKSKDFFFFFNVGIYQGRQEQEAEESCKENRGQETELKLRWICESKERSSNR